MAGKFFIDCGTHLGEGLRKHILSEGINQDWIIHTFEANKNTFDILKNIRDKKESRKNYEWINWENLHFHNKAVWTEATTLEFYCASISKCEELIGKDENYDNFLKYHDDLLKNDKLITRHHRYDLPIDGSSTVFKDHFSKSLGGATVVQRNIEWKEEDKIKVESINFSDFLKSTVTLEDYTVCKMDIEGAEFPVLELLIENGNIKLINKIIIEFHDYGDPDLMNRKNKIINSLMANNIEYCDWE